MRVGWPRLSFWLDLWFLRAQTSIMYEAFANDTFEFLRLDVKLFGRWGFGFNLYTPRYALFQRREKKRAQGSQRKEVRP